jgi:hypothetical protein
VKIPHGQIAERIAFETEIYLQVFFGGVANRVVPDYGQENRPVNNDQQADA